ncbi:MAG: glucose-1-phosphate adenylyltransferase, partial [Thermodesulfobacteriota bacterium]
VRAYPFVEEDGSPGYWRDVGTVESYWSANMDLCHITPELNLYNPDWPIWTYQAQLPPAKFAFDDEGRRGEAIDSLVSAGCILSGSRVKRSIISSDTFVHSYALIKDSVILPSVDIGRNCRINKAIIDKSCKIAPDTVIGEDIEADKKRFYVDENGIVLVTPDMLGQHLHTVR